jgi:hypothetical protein
MENPESCPGTQSLARFRPIGRDGDTHYPLDGRIDDVRVWQTVRTAAQLAAALHPGSRAVKVTVFRVGPPPHFAYR